MPVSAEKRFHPRPSSSMGKPIVLVVAASRLLAPLQPALHQNGFETVDVAYADAATCACGQPAIAIVACETERPLDGLAAVRRLRECDARVPIFFVVESSSEELAIAA